MTAVALAALALAAALVQLGVVPAFFLDAAAVPLLPVALIAAWSAVRDPDETWPVLLVAPAALGVASQDRVGAFLLALLPAAALVAVAGRLRGVRRLAAAPVAGGVGGALYLAVLTAAAGEGGAIFSDAGSYLVAALWTALATALLTLALTPARPREQRAFV